MTPTENLFQALNDAFMQNVPPHIAVAVSGGADSMALCIALYEWCQLQQVSFTALTVDHTLRAESSDEALQVHAWLKQRGIHHEILTWTHPPVLNSIQERAREARYDMMTQYCLQHAIPFLCTAHHQDDQWETFMMRLSHSSGIRGLAGIPTYQKRQGITIVRPFLKQKAAMLKTYLAEKTQPWIDDPSNQNATFERVRWRQQAQTLTQMGITPEVIENVCFKLHQDAVALDWAASEWLTHHTQWHNGLKFMRCNMSLKSLPEALVKRIMLRIASCVRGVLVTTADVRHGMDAVYARVCETPFKPFTIGGCYWMMHKGEMIIVREWDKCPTLTITKLPVIYDYRFRLTTAPIGVQIRSIRKELWPLFKHQFDTPDIPYQVFLSLPITEEQSMYTGHEIDW